MIIKLEEPYSKDWMNGYLVVNTEGRRTVILYNNKTDRSSVSYARYLLSTHLGRYLSPSEHVDHIDNNKTNDTIDNLQILTQKENNAKSAKGRNEICLICPICKSKFIREVRQVMYKKSPVTCSRSCGGKKSHLI